VLSPRILVVDDESIVCESCQRILQEEGYEVECTQDGKEAFEKMRANPFDVVITDLKMPGIDGMDVLKILQKDYPETIIIMITGFSTVETAVEAMKLGAFDYIPKPFTPDEVSIVVKKAVEKRNLMLENFYLRQELRDKYGFQNIIGRSKRMQDVYRIIAKVAMTDSTALIFGQSGTGKELIARAIHFNSPRGPRSFVAVDCSSLAETLLESELFGHVRGAFTGAVTAKKGLFEEADSGTCFLDEIGDISLAMQAKLLRVLQEHEIKRVGGTETLKIDVRIVAATNKNLEELVAEKKFREDLFYRLNVVSIHLPSLRERPDDIPLLADHFLRKFAAQNNKPVCRISPEAMDILNRYGWPGNVRELENVIERTATLTSTNLILPEDLPRRLHLEPAQIDMGSLPSRIPLSELEKLYIQKVLEETGGNKKRAADILGIDRRTLYRMANRLGLTIKR